MRLKTSFCAVCKRAKAAALKFPKHASVCDLIIQSPQACRCCPWLRATPPCRQLLATSARRPTSGPSCCHPRVGKGAPHSPAGAGLMGFRSPSSFSRCWLGYACRVVLSCCWQTGAQFFNENILKELIDCQRSGGHRKGALWPIKNVMHSSGDVGSLKHHVTNL